MDSLCLNCRVGDLTAPHGVGAYHESTNACQLVRLMVFPNLSRLERGHSLSTSRCCHLYHCELVDNHMNRMNHSPENSCPFPCSCPWAILCPYPWTCLSLCSYPLVPRNSN